MAEKGAKEYDEEKNDSAWNDVKLIHCVLGMMLNSFVVVQGIQVELGPCLRCYRACGRNCVRRYALQGMVEQFVRQERLAFLSLYYIL